MLSILCSCLLFIDFAFYLYQYNKGNKNSKRGIKMIRNRLAEILFERDIKIVRIDNICCNQIIKRQSADQNSKEY